MSEKEKDQQSETKEQETTTPESSPSEVENDQADTVAPSEEDSQSSEEEMPTIEKLIESLAEKEAENIRLKEALIAGDTESKDLQSRLRSVSAAYKKEKEDQEAFKQRIERQMEYRSSRRRGEVVKVLFEPLENLRRSHSALSKKDPESAVGLEMVIKAFMTGFTKLGLEEIAPDGQKFDPNEHNALMAQPTQDPALDDVVLQTYSAGYKIEGLILQPAQVIVGKYDGPPVQEVTTEDAQDSSEAEEEPETTQEESADSAENNESDPSAQS